MSSFFFFFFLFDSFSVLVTVADVTTNRVWLRRRQYAPVPKSDTAVEYTGGYQSPMAAEREGMVKKGPEVAAGEVSH